MEITYEYPIEAAYKKYLGDLKSDCVAGYECHDCGALFETMQDLNRHIDFSMTCSSMPNQRFIFRDELDESIGQDPLNMTIPSILKSIRHNSSINSDFSIHSLEKSWIDDDPDYLIYRDMIESQTTVDKYKSYKCNYCPFEADSITQLNFHRQQKHYAAECHICQQKFKDKQSLDSHIKRHQKDFWQAQSGGVCPHCHQNVLKNLKSHILCCNLRMENELRSEGINLKKQVATTRWEKKNVDTSKLVLRFYCRIKGCNKYFNHIISKKKSTRNSNLRKHERSHGSEVEYECWVCKEALETYDDYKEHYVRCAKHHKMPYQYHEVPAVDDIIHIRF